MMLNIQKRIKIAFFSVLATLVVVTSVSPVFAANLGNTAPWPANTTDFPSGNPSSYGGSVFLLRDNPAAGAQRDIRFSVYLPVGTNIGTTELRLTPGTSASGVDVCTTGSGTNVPDYISVTITEPTLSAVPSTRVFNISYANACAAPVNTNNALGSNAGNRLYARYPFAGLPTPGPESKTGMLKYDVVIQFNGDPDDTARFRIFAAMPNVGAAIVSPGTGGLTFPTVANWDEIVNRGQNAAQKLVIPFGMCENNPTPITRTIELYDADNGPSSSFAPRTVYFRIRNISTNTWVAMQPPFQNRSPLDTDPTIFTPANGNAARSAANFEMRRDHFYEMRVFDIANANTIDVKLPSGSESAWGDPDVCRAPIPKPQLYEDVTLTPGINHDAGTGVEVGSPVTFYQNVTVANFPWRPSQWGFNEEARRRADNQLAQPSQSPYSAREVGTTGENGTPERKCASGWATYPVNCGTFICDNGSTRLGTTGCGAGVGGYRWRCVWNGGGGATRYRPANANDPSYGWIGGTGVPGCPIYQYQCRDTAGNWQDQYKNFVNREDEPGCNQRWVCPSPSPVIYYYDPGNVGGQCRVFRCAYESNPALNFYRPSGVNPDDDCDKRCSNGAGAPARNWSPPGSLDDNCYIQPSFTVTCTFAGGASQSEVVTDNGVFCDDIPNDLPNDRMTVNNPPRGPLCQITIASATGWQGTPPGKGIDGDVNHMRVIWNIVPGAPAQACAQVGQRPYFHVYGGDVNAKTAFADIATNTCTTANTTSILAWNTGAPNHYGSGVQLAALARGTIDGFTSSSIGTNRPTGLTFANTGAGYGGNFMGSLDCISNTDIPVDNSLSQNVSGLVTTKDWRNYGSRDVYITGPITYPPSFSLNAVPSLKIITDGDIYISSGVTEVSGTFIARGKIFTCAVANGLGGLRAPTQAEMAASCESQLRVNGSLTASQVKLLRTIGSVGYAQLDARGRVGLEAAAELFNYTPDVWIHDLGAPTPPNTELPTESIVNLPPIL